MTDFPITGFTAPGFEPVRQEFEANFAEDKELGAGFAVYLDGALVVDLCGGFADRRKERQAHASESLVSSSNTTNKPEQKF